MTAAPKISIGKLKLNRANHPGQPQHREPSPIAATTSEEILRQIPVSDIYPCPLNRDVDTGSESFRELVESIRKHGVQQPIQLRIKPSGDTYYEIIAGERRWLASKAAGLEFIPARIVEADDAKATELRAIENLHREDLTALDEAEAYKQLMELKHTAEEVAERVGKSRTVVYARLALLHLPEIALKAMRSGRLPASHAELILRLKREKLRAEFTEVMLNPKKWTNRDDDGEETVMSYRDAKQYLRTWLEKEENTEAYEAAAAKFTQAGHKVLSEKASRDILPYGDSPGNHGDWARLEDYGLEWETWSKILNKKSITGLTPTLAMGRLMKPIILYKREDLLKAAKAQGWKPKHSASGGNSEAAAKKSCQKRRKVHLSAVEHIVHKLEGEQNEGDLMWDLLLGDLRGIFGRDCCDQAFKRRFPEEKCGLESGTRLSKASEKMTRPQRRALIVELMLHRHWPSTYDGQKVSRVLTEVCQRLGVNLKILCENNGVKL